MRVSFWLRWSWRGVRRRAPQVGAIAAVLALGSGIYSGLGSTSAWRTDSLEASLHELAAHDLRVSVAAGTLDAGTLAQAVRSALGASASDVETRLVVAAPVTATTPVDGDDPPERIPAAGQLVAVDLADGPRIDRWRVVAGRDLRTDEAGRPTAVLDQHFALAHDLPETGTIHVGSVDIDYVGLALAPEYLNLTVTSGEAVQGAATRAVLFTSLATAEQVTGQPGVNDAVVRLAEGTDPTHAASVLRGALAELIPGAPVTVATLQDDASVQALRDEITSEQRLFDAFSLLIVAGAGFAAFNLTKRVSEAQRREIGIAMALGVPRPTIALRTLVFAAGIVAAGVVLGIGAGYGISLWVLSIIRTRIPLPVWETPLQIGLFAEAAALTVVIPVVAAAVPVWQAVRVQPVQALLPPHLRSGHHRLHGLVRRISLPGLRTTAQTPLRRIFRAPARSLVTVLAVSFIVAPLLAALGASDSAAGTIDAGQAVLGEATGDRLVVDLAGYQPQDSALVQEVATLPGVDGADVGLNSGGYLRHGDRELAASIAMVDFTSSRAPHVQESTGASGIVISRKAAADLDVAPGETLVLTYPRPTSTGFAYARASLPVAGLSDSPYRFVAYLDLAERDRLGLSRLVNTVKLTLGTGVSMSALQEQAAALPGVASALPASALADTMHDVLDVVNQLFVILKVVIAVLAFLVAFNASNVAAEERAREHATMLAFGVRPGSLLAMAVLESVTLGVLGTALGLAGGSAVLTWILETVFPAAVPDLAVHQTVTATSWLVTVVIALTAIAVAPLLNVRRLRTMDLPSALRYVE